VGRTTKLRQVWVVSAAATATLLAGCGVLQDGSATETVLIGVDLELTGDGSQLAEIYRNALQLRVEQINEQGLLGDRQIELDIRDNRSDAATSAANVEDLANDEDAAAVITGGCNACAAASLAVANELGIPMISLASVSEITEPVNERPWVFKIAPNAADNASLIGAALVQAEAETIAVVATEDPYGVEGAEAMSQTASRIGVEVPLTERLTNEDSVRSAAERIAAYQPADAAGGLGLQPPEGEDTGPDAIVVWAPPAITADFANALRAADYDGPLFLDSIAADELFLADSEAALSGATMVFTEALVIDRVIATSPAKVARRNWFNAYTARYGTFHAFSVFPVDALQLMVETVNRLDTTDRETVRDGLERLQIEGVSGPLRISPRNHSGLSSLGLITLVAQGGRWQAS
jgi:branched-chain amino acid transport system substrate-binding protein